MADVITNFGKDKVAENIGGLSSYTFKRLALGTGGSTAEATQTALDAIITDSGLTISTATVSTATSNVLQLVKTWTASGSKTIQECGVFDSSDNMFARSNFTGIAVDSDDSIQITYKITVS